MNIRDNLYCGDCLEVMQDIPDASVDMVLCDLPYGMLNKGNSNAKWDIVIPFEPLWKQYLRICKDNAAIVLFGSGMFTAKLMMSQPKLWRYNLIWDKVLSTGFLNANRMPLRGHEDILVFYRRLPVYHPQMEKAAPHARNHGRGSTCVAAIEENRHYIGIEKEQTFFDVACKRIKTALQEQTLTFEK